MRGSCACLLVALLPVACFDPSDEEPSEDGTGSSGAATTSGSSESDPQTGSSSTSSGSSTSSDPTTGTSSSSSGEGSSSTASTEETGESCGEDPLPPCDLPDLRVTLIGAAASVNGLELTYVVRNDGTAASGPYQLDFWDTRTGGFDNPPGLGDSGTITLSDQRPIAPGGREQSTVTIRTPPSGTHVAFAIVDSRDAIAELDENDNVALGSAWTDAGGTEHTSFAAALEDPLEIPEDGSVASLEVGVAATSEDPELFFSLNVTHSDVSEIDARVIAPNGATRQLVAGGVDGSNLQSTTLRDGAIMITMGDSPFAGEFGFAGVWSEAPTVDGSWTLEVAGGVGEVGGFSVHVLSD